MVAVGPVMQPAPFRVRCLFCGTVAESWPRGVPAPVGAIIGLARCACGQIGADASGTRRGGRVVTEADPDAPFLLPPFQILDQPESRSAPHTL